MLRILSDVDCSTLVNDLRPSASFSARTNPQCIAANTPPVIPGRAVHPQWPTAMQTVIADTKGFVWIAGTGPQDSILKFTRDGKFVWDFGHRPTPETTKGRFQLDEQTNELYIIQQ